MQNTMYNVGILLPAWKDLERITDMLMTLVGVNSAKSFTDGLLDRIDTLSCFPFAYPTVPDEELAKAGYRMLIYKKYLTIYRVIENTVYVYHIADERSNYPQIIKGYNK